MSFMVSWYTGYEGRIILHSIEGQVTLDDIHIASMHTAQLIREGQPPVHLVADVRHKQYTPLRAGQIALAAVHFREPQLGWQVVIGASAFVANMSGIIAVLGRVRLRSVESHAEALSFLVGKDPTLDVHHGSR